MRDSTTPGQNADCWGLLLHYRGVSTLHDVTLCYAQQKHKRQKNYTATT